MIRVDLIAPLSELLERQAKRFPEKVAYSDPNREITYGELNRATFNLATWMRHHGIGRDKAVAIWLPNSVEWVITCLAAVRAGGIAVPISYDAVRDEVAYRLDDAACAIIVTKGERVRELDEIGQTTPVSDIRILTDTPGGEAALDFGALCAAPAPGIALEPDDIDGTSYIVYTSGTTGKAKGVMLSTRALLWATAACWTPILGLDENDRVLSPLPLFHSYALTISVLSILATGAQVHIMNRFSTSGALDLLNRGGFTFMPGVPTMFHYLMQAVDEHGGEPFASMRCCISAGAILPATLNADFEKRFGVQLLDGYGITEMSTMVTMNWPGTARMPGSCGLPIPGLAVRIIDPSTGLDVPFGEEGELICRGPNLMLGYNRKPEETKAVLRDGWYYTGDLARSDKHGFLTITGRLKEIIIRGGQNIAPAEVEETILLLDEVLDCAVVGVPDQLLGEVPHAFVVVKSGRRVDLDLLKDHCLTRLSAYKVPAGVVVLEEIPRTGSGKIMRFKLRELVGG